MKNRKTQPTETVTEELKPEPMEKKKKRNLNSGHCTGKQEEEIFIIRPTEFKSKINVVGQIDLAALNQSTRPKRSRKKNGARNVKKKINSVRNSASK